MMETSAYSVPEWVPVTIRRYLAHMHQGQSIRDLARDAGCHASTVLRQIRRVEHRREDPLVDAAIESLARAHYPQEIGAAGPTLVTTGVGGRTGCRGKSDAASFERESCRVLRRLCESGALLAVADDMDKAVVMRDAGEVGSARTAVVDVEIAQVLALRDWIACNKPGRVSRYRVTAAGRAALGRLLADAENRARATSDYGCAEATVPFSGPDGRPAASLENDEPRRTRYAVAESPLVALSRHKDRDGHPFLDERLVRAGERLREDFELAQTGPQITQNWDKLLTGAVRGGHAEDALIARGPREAQNRVARALTDLGPGLSDVALRCCCYLEGLELAERRMGWSARSGKIVLRIALQRLSQHYEGLSERERMIG